MSDGARTAHEDPSSDPLDTPAPSAGYDTQDLYGLLDTPLTNGAGAACAPAKPGPSLDGFVPARPADDMPRPPEHNKPDFAAPLPLSDTPASQRQGYALPASLVPALSNFCIQMAMLKSQEGSVDVQQNSFVQLKHEMDQNAWMIRLTQAVVTMLQNSIPGSDASKLDSAESLTGIDFSTLGVDASGKPLAWPQGTFAYWWAYQALGRPPKAGEADQYAGTYGPPPGWKDDSTVSIIFMRVILGLPNTDPETNKAVTYDGSGGFKATVQQINTWISTLNSNMSNLATNNNQSMNTMNSASQQYLTSINTAGQTLQTMLQLIASVFRLI
ncbi:hypothetical protein QS306_09145 [Paraburkholderia bonniea]|uniref:hypothetical protein n=1 Tax=Paraburkholderia bonniea TaxID=2152891 RepID=UPI001291C43C|nr:hypothetical protein [Paraburkholderia bonniea]WJF89288.1 hypothetical protein QS306_09145 [Paraburkholderia bonniea]WJF92604.1 hypothetical protein QS308_09155 [Paraburkholderia bonniea]